MTDSMRTRFQFGIRHLLVVMAVVSTLAAVMGPTLRQWSAGQWGWYAAHLIAAAVIYAVTLRQRFHGEEMRHEWVGEIRWQVPLEWEVRSPLPWWGRIVIAVVLLGGTVGILEVLSIVVIDSAGGPWSMVGGLTLGLLAGGGVFDETTIPTHASIGDNGLLLGRTFLPWRRVGPPSEDKGEPVRIVWPQLGLKCTLVLPAENEAAIRTFVRGHMLAGGARRQG